MALIQAYAKKTGSEIKTSIEGGITTGTGTHGMNTGAMREALVLIREISRGNWTKVPGSASILLSRLSLLKYVLNPVVGITAAIAAGFYLIWHNTKKWTDQLESSMVPDFLGKFIARQDQTWNMVAMALKETNKELKKTVELYQSAEKVAERDLETIREKYNHLRKMNEFSRGPGKEERQVALNDMERTEIINSKEVERLGLIDEEKKKRKAANDIQVEGAKKLENDVELAKRNADAARKWLEGNKKFEAEHKRGSFLVPAAVKDELEKVKKQKNDEIQKEKDLQQQQADNNDKLKQRADLEKEANEAAKKARAIELALPDLRAKFAKQTAYEAEEAAAKESTSMRFARGHLSALQKIGAFAPDAVMIDTGKKSLHELKGIHATLKQRQGAEGGRGRVVF